MRRALAGGRSRPYIIRLVAMADPSARHTPRGGGSGPTASNRRPLTARRRGAPTEGATQGA
eukprot:6268231-Alexandrium_andersonii.AAC.1